MVYLASKPDRATDGNFLNENVEYLDFLTMNETQGGEWLSESQVDPGRYYVVLEARDNDCLGEPTCLDGYSGDLPLTVPEPSHGYRGSAEVLHDLHIVYLRLRVTRLGNTLPYKVCFRLKSNKRRCVSGKVDGFSWNEWADDILGVQMRGMKRRTTFAWYVRGRKVASKSANTARL